MCNLAWGEAGVDSWATFGDVVVPLLGWRMLALHLAITCPPQKIKNLPDVGFWPLVSGAAIGGPCALVERLSLWCIFQNLIFRIVYCAFLIFACFFPVTLPGTHA